MITRSETVYLDLTFLTHYFGADIFVYESIGENMAKKNDKKIRIACQGAETITLDKIVGFQGDLKTLSEQNYFKLRGLILKHGFSFPFQLWKNKGKIFILDGHQRMATLKRLRDEEGYVIPPLPLNWVEAATRKEAAEKVLAAVSQYGEMSNQGLFDFITEFKIEMPELSSQFDFSNIDFDRFQKTFFPEIKEVTFTVKTAPPKEPVEEEEEEDDADTHTCPKCGYEF